jgi:hypothetical protein
VLLAGQQGVHLLLLRVLVRLQACRERCVRDCGRASAQRVGSTTGVWRASDCALGEHLSVCGEVLGITWHLPVDSSCERSLLAMACSRACCSRSGSNAIVRGACVEMV